MSLRDLLRSQNEGWQPVRAQLVRNQVNRNVAAFFQAPKSLRRIRSIILEARLNTDANETDFGDGAGRERRLGADERCKPANHARGIRVPVVGHRLRIAESFGHAQPGFRIGHVLADKTDKTTGRFRRQNHGIAPDLANEPCWMPAAVKRDKNSETCAPTKAEPHSPRSPMNLVPKKPRARRVVASAWRIRLR